MRQLLYSHKLIYRIIRLIIANTVLALILSIIFFDAAGNSLSNFLKTMAWAFIICITQWTGHSYIHTRLDRIYSWQEQPVKRAISNTLAIIVYAVIAYLVVSIIMVRIVYGGLPENPITWALKYSYNAILISLAVSIIVVTIGFFNKWKSSLLEAERLKAEMLRYKYEALQNQINPHFLFNSFNVLSDLVYEDRKKAVKFIEQMSQLFRYVLESRDRELVPISEEVDFIASYVYLLQMRFEDKLSITVDVNTASDELIVPMTLQLLIENCVKHNEISSSKPLSINVSREESRIVVKNNLQPKKTGPESTETGLSNIKQQFGYFTDSQISITKTEESYAVEVPLISAEIK